MLFSHPSTWWTDITPRAWQAEAMTAAVEALATAEPAIIQAVMGSGKSLLIAELCRRAIVGPDEVVVVTTSSVALVEQLASVIQDAGRYYTHAKDLTQRVIVACIDSAEALALQLTRSCVLWIADEAHRTECDQMHRAFKALAPANALGFTATPYRSRKTEELSLFSRLVYQYGPVDGLRDGVILPWRVVPWDGDEVSLDDAALQLIKVHGVGPGVVNANTVADAEAFAARLSDEWRPSLPIHSYLDQATQRARLEALRTGEVACLVHVAMLQEGVDLPWLRWLCLRRSTSSRVRFAQEVGRVLRCYPGKTCGVILDPLDLFGALRLSYDAVLQGQAEDSAAAPLVSLQPLGGDWWSTSVDPLEAGMVRGVAVRVHTERMPQPYDALRVVEARPGAIRLPGVTVRTPVVARLAPVAVEVVDAAEAAALPLPPDPAVALDDVGRYLRLRTIELEQGGAYQRRTASRQWRESDVTPYHWRRLRAALALPQPWLAEPHRSATRNACLVAHRLRRGQVADLTDVLEYTSAHGG